MAGAKAQGANDTSNDRVIATDDLVIAEVAPGRTVTTDDGNKGPGEEVLLTPAEARRLMPLGFIVDPDADPIPEGNGPRFERR